MAFGLSAGAVAAISALGGAAISAYGSNKAAGAQADAANHAADLSNEQYQQSRADQLAQIAQQRADTQQYRDAGYTALSQLSGGTKDGGDFNRNFSMADFQADPGYKFRLDQGEEGINRAATAAGSRYSGATLKALSRFNSGLASQEYGNAYSRFNSDIGNRFGRLASMAGIGQAATTQVGQGGQNGVNQMTSAGMQSAITQGNAYQNAGAARASGYVGIGNAINGTIGNMSNNYSQSRLLSDMRGNGSNDYNGTSYGYMVPRNLPSAETVIANGGYGIE